MIAVAALLGAASCSNEEPTQAGETTKVTFSTNLEGVMGSRAYGDGTTVDKVVFMAYDEAGNIIPGLTQRNVTLTGNTAVVNVQLVSGKTYNFAFFAYDSESNYYNLNDLTKVGVVNPTEYAGNEEGRDAFCAAINNYVVNGNVSQNVTLRRPFAQINLITKDLLQAEAAGLVAPAKVQMTISNVCNTYNVLTGVASGSSTVNVAQNIINANESITIGGVAYGSKSYLSMNYILVPSTSSLVDCHIAIADNYGNAVSQFDATSVPAKANYRTNIMGNFFTNPGQFDIVVDQSFMPDAE